MTQKRKEGSIKIYREDGKTSCIFWGPFSIVSMNMGHYPACITFKLPLWLHNWIVNNL